VNARQMTTIGANPRLLGFSNINPLKLQNKKFLHVVSCGEEGPK
jgi:hypothetical protein